MCHRVLPLCAAVLFLALVSPVPVSAEDKDKDKTHEGLVVKAGSATLVMTDNDGKNEHRHAVAKDAKITCDGKECKLEDLKKGYKVKVTTEKKDEKTVATKIEAKKAE